jgi:FkbM family methyltransferase
VSSLRECLVKNIAANNATQLAVVPLALSNSPGQIEMHIPSSHPGMAMCVSESSNLESTTMVDCTTFDIWLCTLGFRDVSVCKIDVEGHELAVLQGMTEALERRAVGALVIERHHVMTPSDPVYQLLTDRDYAIKRIFKKAFSILYAGVDELLGS